MRFTTLIGMRLWIVLLAATVGAEAPAQEAGKEQAAEALASFKKKIAGAKCEKITEAFKALAGVRHETVLKELLKWAEKPSNPPDVKVKGNGSPQNRVGRGSIQGASADRRTRRGRDDREIRR